MNWRGVHLGEGESYDRTVGLQDKAVFLIARLGVEPRWTVFFQASDESLGKFSERVSGLVVNRTQVDEKHTAHRVLGCEGDFFELTSFDSYPAAKKLCRDIYYHRERN